MRVQRSTRSCMALTVCAFLASAAFAAGPRAFQDISSTSAGPTGRLHVTSDDLASLGGWFEGEEAIAFSARSELRNAISATITAPGLELRVAIDVRRGVATIDGQGQITAASRPVLQDFTNEVLSWLAASSRERGMHTHALTAAAALVAAAPVGWEPTHTIVGPEGAGPGAAPAGNGVPCQQGDQDGIDYLSGGCSFEPYTDICHDSQAMCFTCEEVVNGCNEGAGCPGNCLPGCPFGGRGWYTRDCAEYDRCCDLNADCNTFGVCLDELRESLNDILLGWRELNCVEGCAAATP